MTGYPLDALYQEVAYIAYYFHWSHEQVMSMEHAERKRWVDEIATVNRRINSDLDSRG